jgi:ubiquinone/menaquinone biosynthesis C-methylase UbiE
MSDYTIFGNEKLYNIWKADQSTQLYKNEMLRNHRLFEIIKSQTKINNIIDVGCGTGYLDYLLARDGKQITGIDLSKNSLNMFNDIAERLNITQINENLYNLNFNGFDAVISQEVLEHIEDYESALVKMCSFIKSDGYGFFCVPYNENLEAKMITDPSTGKRVHKVGHLHSFTIDKLVYSVNKSGFNVLQSFLLVNKRSFKLFSKFKIPVNKFTLIIDKVMNKLFPHKAAYLAVIGRKNK